MKFECSTEQPFTIVIQFKNMQSRLFSVNIYRDVMISNMSMPIDLQSYSVCSKYPPSARRHALSRADVHATLVNECVDDALFNAEPSVLTKTLSQFVVLM